MQSERNSSAALIVDELSIDIKGSTVVDGVSFDIGKGEILAIVGESGCGKSLTALSIMGLLEGDVRISGGHILFDDKDLVSLSDADWKDIRGNKLTMIFQEPIESLNPLMRAGAQVGESLLVHGQADKASVQHDTIAMLRKVGIPDAEQRVSQYPFELSGGMCQRLMIASALITQPQLLIADEPTTALDVTVQAQILELMKNLRREQGTAILIITHDLGVVADIADRVCVMYGGRTAEIAPVDALFTRPAHPYTRMLLATIPSLTGTRKRKLRFIEGTVPDFSEWPDGCRFRTRCPLADAACEHTPPLVPLRSGDASHTVACWHTDRLGELQ